MANNVHMTVEDCRSNAQDRSQMKRKCGLKLFPGAGPLELVVIDVMVAIPKTPAGNQNKFNMTNRYPKRTLAIPPGNNALNASEDYNPLQLDTPVYGIPNYALENKAPSRQSVKQWI